MALSKIKFHAIYILFVFAGCRSDISQTITPDVTEERIDGSITDLENQYNDLGTIKIDGRMTTDMPAPKQDGNAKIADSGRISNDSETSRDADIADLLEPITPSCALPNDPPVALAPDDDSAPLFARENLPVFEITITPENWQAFCANAVAMARTVHDSDFEPLYAEASLVVSGEAITAPIGLRAHGKSSLTSLYAGGDDFERCLENRFRAKPNFKISFSKYSPGTRYRGLKKINLIGHEGNETLLKEYLFNTIAENLDLPAPRTNHAALCINGEYWGIYSNQEEIDDQPFLNHHFPDSSDGNYYKVESGGHLLYPSGLEEDFRANYKPVAGTPSNMPPLMDFLRFVNLSNDADFQREIESRIDLHDWLGITALETVLFDADGAYNRGSNFTIYQDTFSKWRIIRFDQDLILLENTDAWDDETEGPRLFCYYWNRRGSRNNANGTAPMRSSEFTVWNINYSVLQARLLFGNYPNEYMEHITQVLDASELMDDYFNERIEFIGPWIGSETENLDPFELGRDVWILHVENLRAKFHAQLNMAEAQYETLLTTGVDSITCP